MATDISSTYGGDTQSSSSTTAATQTISASTFSFVDSVYITKFKILPQQEKFFIGESVRLRAGIGLKKDQLFIKQSQVSSISCSFYTSNKLSSSISQWNPVTNYTNITVPVTCIYEISNDGWKYDDYEYNFEYVPTQGSTNLITKNGLYICVLKLIMNSGRLPCILTGSFNVF